MSHEIMKKTFEELRNLGIKGRLSNVMITRSTRLYTPWTLSYVVYDDGYVGCGTGCNGFDVPLDLSFIKELLDLDVYKVVEELEQRKGTMFDNSLIISIASALSHRIMSDEALLKVQGFDVKILPQAAIGAIVDLGLITSTDVVAVVGYFYSYIPKIAEVARTVNVTELEPLSDFDIYDFRPKKTNVRVFPTSQSKNVISNADIVIITGMTLANDTASELLGYARNARLVMMIGPTCSFYPKVLFEAGVDIVGAILLPNDERFRNHWINSRGYWYYEKELKHLLISAQESR